MENEPLGAMLVRLRERKGYTQLQLAESLCAASGQPTVTRHEVSRWEREERVPSRFWLGWFAEALDVPLAELEAAQRRSRNGGFALPTDRATTLSTGPAPKVRDHARSPNRSKEGSVATVLLKYEHRATNVQLNGTYEAPEQATAAIGIFRMMVTPGDTELGPVPGANGGRMPSGTTGAGARPQIAGSSARQPATSPPGAQARPPAQATAALTANGSARVPMGIRHTKGPGTADTSDGRG